MTQRWEDGRNAMLEHAQQYGLRSLSNAFYWVVCYRLAEYGLESKDDGLATALCKLDRDVPLGFTLHRGFDWRWKEQS